MEARDLGGLDEEITGHVQAIDEGLRWELGPGSGDRSGFALVWDGDITRRRITERWLATAPENDAAWEFFPARPPGTRWEEMTMDLGPHKIDFSKFVCAFAPDENTERVDVEIFHPATVKVPENVRGTAAFVMLDRAFGEDGVERWLGSIEIATKKPKDAVPISALVAAVAAMQESATGDVCNLYEGDNDGAPVFILKNEALKIIDHLHCDQALAVTITYDAEATGLPSKAESEALDAIEDALIEALGDDAVYHGRETGSGERTIYMFTTTEAPKLLAPWADKAGREIEVEMAPDPGWEGLERWS
ncbi:MAG: DUF695 domain-containing protein [Polyangiales bacterium]